MAQISASPAAVQAELTVQQGHALPQGPGSLQGQQLCEDGRQQDAWSGPLVVAAGSPCRHAAMATCRRHFYLQPAVAKGQQ